MASESSVGEQKPPQSPEEAPDPDEDDLSDLDDVLDQFTSLKLEAKTDPLSSGPGRPPNIEVPPPEATSSAPRAATGSAPTSAPTGLLPDDDEFARQLQAGMQDLLGELDSNPEMAGKFGELMKELNDAAQSAVDAREIPVEEHATSASKDTGSGPKPKQAAMGPEPAASAGVSGSPDVNFQESIRKTMERMQNSSESASAAAASSSQDDFLASLLKEMESNPSAFPSGLGNDEDFSKMLMGMMEQLTNKDVLYEPMKELHDKFPAWMAENKGKVGSTDWKRYEEQHVLVKEIVGKFESDGYSDEKVECREYIVERMQKMQAAGSPPPDLVGDMNAAQEALGELDAGCPTQ